MKLRPIPGDFKVTPRITELAKQNGWPNPQTELDAFKDYHRAHGSRMADWEAAFRTWLRNCARWAKPASPGKPRTRAEQQNDRIQGFVDNKLEREP